MTDETIGHTPDGEPVCVRQMVSLFEDVTYVTIEVGRFVFRLDHSDPELIPALTRSLQRPPQAAA